MKKTLVLLLLLLAFAVPSHAASAPEIFVQTGHSGGVNFVAINPSGTYLVTMEDSSAHGKFVKTWDMSTGREIRTVKLTAEYTVTGIQFADDSRFIVFYRKIAEIFDIYGQKTGSLALPNMINVQGPVLSRDGQYFFNQEFGTKIYSMKDGSEIKLPEMQKYSSWQIYHQNVADLGYGYYGIFFQRKDPKGNVDYVIYDENLNVRLKGSLDIPNLQHMSKFKISSDLKYVAHQNLKATEDINVYDLESGSLVLNYRPRPLAKSGTVVRADESLFFGFTPDSRLRVEYDLQQEVPFSARMEMVLINPVKNGIRAEKTLHVGNVVTWIAYEYHCRPYVMTEKGLIAGFANGNVKIIDLNTGAEIRSFGVKPSVFSNSNCEGNRILNFHEDWISVSDKMSVSFNLWDLSEPALKKVNVKSETNRVKRPIQIGNYRSESFFSTDPDALYKYIPPDFLMDNYKQGERYGQTSGIFMILRNSGE
ncbi:MAG: WD40 repeat domain-containing protein, partial [Syntrophaceae bacterium]